MPYITFFSFAILSISFMYFILNKVFNYDYRSNRLAFFIASVILAVICAVSIYTSADATQQLDRIDAILLLAFVVFPYLIAKPNKKSVFLWFGLVFSATVDFSIHMLKALLDLFDLQGKGFLKNLSDFSKEYFYGSVFFIFVFILTLLLYRKIAVNKSLHILDRVPAWIYVAIYLADFSTYYKTLATGSDIEYVAEADRLITLISGVLIATCIIYGIVKYSQIILRQQQAELQLSLQYKHYEELSEKNSDIRKFRHDIKNNLFAVRSLISDNRNKEALEYIDEMDQNLSSTKMSFYTGNRLADAILSDKSGKALKENIVISFEGSIPADEISNYDLCTIMTNAIDNATEACRMLSGERRITIRGRETNQAFAITFSNPVAEDITVKNNRIKTTKADKENHGFGTENIRQIIRKNNGTFKLSCENKVFTLSVAIPRNK